MGAAILFYPCGLCVRQHFLVTVVSYGILTPNDITRRNHDIDIHSVSFYFIKICNDVGKIKIINTSDRYLVEHHDGP